jgi:hypothetical protein
MERGSLLDVILKTYEVRTRMWEGLLDSLRGLEVVGVSEPEFGKILIAIRYAMREIVPDEWIDAPHLRVSEPTREDLRHACGPIAEATAAITYARSTNASKSTRKSGASSDRKACSRARLSPPRAQNGGFWRAQFLYQNGAPRPMKMGTTCSLWRCDVATRRALQSASRRHPCNFALRLGH